MPQKIGTVLPVCIRCISANAVEENPNIGVWRRVNAYSLACNNRSARIPPIQWPVIDAGSYRYMYKRGGCMCMYTVYNTVETTIVPLDSESRSFFFFLFFFLRSLPFFETKKKKKKSFKRDWNQGRLYVFLFGPCFLDSMFEITWEREGEIRRRDKIFIILIPFFPCVQVTTLRKTDSKKISSGEITPRAIYFIN